MAYHALNLGLLSIALLLACLYDWKSRRIPNALTFPTLLLGFALNLAAHGRAGACFSLLGIAAALVALAPHALGMLGAGDVKLLLAVGAFAGPLFTLRAMALTALAGAGLALLWASRRQNRQFPYAFAIFAGVALAGAVP